MEDGGKTHGLAEGKPHEDEARLKSSPKTRTSGASRSWERQKDILGTFSSQTHGSADVTFDFRCLACELTRINIPVVLGNSVCISYSRTGKLRHLRTSFKNTPEINTESFLASNGAFIVSPYIHR